MTKTIAKTFVLLMTIIGGSIGVWLAEKRYSTAYQVEKLEADKKQLQEEKLHLETFINRLAVEKHVANLRVKSQEIVKGELKTTVIFAELDRNGNDLPARTFTIDGDEVHVDAMVIKFDRELVGNDDSLRGHSIALFHRLYSGKQTPEKGFPLNTPGDVPATYQLADKTKAKELTPAEETQIARQINFEKDLWKNFWQMSEDATLRKMNGVRVANGTSMFHQQVKADTMFTITLEADGGFNYDITPVREIYRDPIKNAAPKVD